jgi:exonuclease SbcD
MRIIHFADLHIGVETYGRPDPATGLSTRLLDFLSAFDELVERAIADDVDLVLFAGDAYKTREPSQTQQREFARRLRRLTEAGIPVFLLIGNHDLPNAFSRANALEIFDTLGIERIHVAPKPTVHVIPTKSGPLQIAALPWMNMSQLLTRDDYKNLSIDQVDRMAADRLNRVVADFADELDPDMPSVLAAHVAMNESLVKTGSEKWMTVGHFPQLAKSTLAASRFDYVALGHHHVYQRLEHATPMYYPGSLQRVDFGEEDDPKGFLVAELDPKRVAGGRLVGEPEFAEIGARRFVTVSLRPKAEDPTAETLTAIDKAKVGDAIVRVQLRLTAQQDALLREAEVRRALEPAHYIASIQRQVDHDDRRRLPGDVRVERLTPLDALDLFLKQRESPPEERERMLAAARSLLDQEGHAHDEADA